MSTSPADSADELAALRRERDAAVEMLQYRTHFFVAASHDLRQPLHALGLLGRALEQHALPSDAQGMLHRMTQAVGMLEEMFDDLLDLSRVDSHGLAPEMQSVRLQRVYDRVAAHTEPEAFDKGLTLSWRGGHHCVRADPVLLERMLRNLVHNAIRYTEDGGVLVGARRRGDRCGLSVYDSGAGMAADTLPRIFDRYVRADGTTPRHGALGPRGFGLGLAIVQRCAQAQDVPLTVRSVPGRGSVFTMAFAAAPDMAGTAPNRLATLSGQRVALCVADSALRADVAGLLSRWHASVEDIEHPVATLAGQPPALVITDRTHALAGLVAAWPHGVPVILLGGEVDADAPGLTHVLPLPMVPNRLRALIAYKLAEPNA